MSRRIQNATALQSEFVTAACEATGKDAEEVAKIVAPIIAYLQAHYAGSNLYISRRGRTINVDDLRRDYEKRTAIRVLCKRYSISQRTLYRLVNDPPAE